MARIVGVAEALSHIASGSTVMVGGFGLVGQPIQLLEALARGNGVGNLTVISNNVGEPGRGLGQLLERGMISRAIGSFFTSNPRAIEEHRARRLELDLIPQGTLAEAIRCGGAGIPAFYTPTAAGTALAEGLECREFDGRPHVLVPCITADVALIKARTSDRLGNLTYYKTARNFNPVMATAAKVVIAQVDDLVDEHSSREEIVTPHIYIDMVVQIGAAHG